MEPLATTGFRPSTPHRIDPPSRPPLAVSTLVQAPNFPAGRQVTFSTPRIPHRVTLDLFVDQNWLIVIHNGVWVPPVRHKPRRPSRRPRISHRVGLYPQKFESVSIGHWVLSGGAVPSLRPVLTPSPEVSQSLRPLQPAQGRPPLLVVSVRSIRWMATSNHTPTEGFRGVVSGSFSYRTPAPGGSDTGSRWIGSRLQVDRPDTGIPRQALPPLQPSQPK